MDLITFARLVSDMRACQRAYFVGGNQADLRASKAAEHRVDNLVNKILFPSGQLEMFGPAGRADSKNP